MANKVSMSYLLDRLELKMDRFRLNLSTRKLMKSQAKGQVGQVGQDFRPYPLTCARDGGNEKTCPNLSNLSSAATRATQPQFRKAGE